MRRWSEWKDPEPLPRGIIICFYGDSVKQNGKILTVPKAVKDRNEPVTTSGRASTIFQFQIIEAPHGCGFGEILSPGIGPLDSARARKIGKLTRPIQDLASFFRRECPHHAD
jgi:hypothetical protein